MNNKQEQSINEKIVQSEVAGRHQLIFNGILEKRAKERAMPERSIDEINADIARMPAVVQESVSSVIDDLRESSKDDESFRRLLNKEVERAMAQYIDARFNMPNKVFAKAEVRSAIDGLLGNQSSLEDLKRVARVSIDVNGLKAVNDLNRGDHSKGDIFLEAVAEAINIEEIIVPLRDAGITAIITADGGDEFGIVLISLNTIDTEMLNSVTGKIRNSLYSQETRDKVEKVLDFNDEKVISSFAGLTEKEWSTKADEEKQRIISELNIPSGFKFQAHASIGVATLYDSFTAMAGEKHEIDEDDNYEKVLDKMMGGVFTKSDGNMQQQKSEFKRGLRESSSSHDKFMSLVYSRTSVERELTQEIDRIQGDLDQCLRALGGK